MAFEFRGQSSPLHFFTAVCYCLHFDAWRVFQASVSVEISVILQIQYVLKLTMNEFATEKHFNKIVVLHDDSVKCMGAAFPAKLSPSESVPQVCIHNSAAFHHFFNDAFNQLQDKFLSHLKERLNSTKSRLNHLNLDEWHQHTRTANPAGRILWHVRNACNPELLTQAWLKFYQILECFPLVAEGNKIFSTLHLCEAPGAFVTALNHHLQNNANCAEVFKIIHFVSISVIYLMNFAVELACIKPKSPPRRKPWHSDGFRRQIFSENSRWALGFWTRCYWRYFERKNWPSFIFTWSVQSGDG